MGIPILAQVVNVLAAFLLLIAFAMLSQRRVLTLIHLLAWQGAALAASTAIVAWSTGQTHLYYSALLTVLLKVILIPWVLHRLIDRLFVRWDIETLINIPSTMLIGIALFAPWGIAEAGDWSALPVAFAALAAKLALAGTGLALIETLLAKLRLFLAPEFLSTAFLLAVLGMLTHFLVKG